MKVIIVGASGTIGKAVEADLSQRHEIVRVNRTSGDFQLDISDLKSIEDAFSAIGSFDALISTTGKVHFGAFEHFTADQYEIGLRNKLMGQVNLVSVGLKYINDSGSFTLTSGLLNEEPILGSVSASMVNGGIEGFVRAAAIAMPRRIRINVVSPTVVEESLPVYASFFRGTKPAAAAEVALGYVKSVEGAQTGRVYRAGWTLNP